MPAPPEVVSDSPEAFDAIVIGTGFAGAVTACRLAQAGQNICVLERGRRYDNADSDLPVYPRAASTRAHDGLGDRSLPDYSRLLWALSEGLWDIRNLGDVLIAQAAGFGGGSLIYANVHLRAPTEIFDHHWPEQYRGGALDPYYDLAAHMLDVQAMPEKPGGREIRKTTQMEAVAERLGRKDSFFHPPLAVNFKSDKKARPGKPRDGECDLRGDCCFGCAEQAKNTLDLNYLAIAEEMKRPLNEGDPESDWVPYATVYTLAEVTNIARVSTGPRYLVTYRSHLFDATEVRHVAAEHVFLCAGAVNSTELLMRSAQDGSLPLGGSGLGERYFTNADAVGAVFDSDDLQEASRGPTITSALVHNHLPEDEDPLARWTLGFEAGSSKPTAGSLITDGHHAAARIVEEPIVTSDAWASKKAAGELILSHLRGEFPLGSEIFWVSQDGGIEQKIGVCSKEPTKNRHWLLFQEGGMPAELEPLLGVLRSPLWLRRNRYREEDAHWKAVATQRAAYANLPFGTLADALSSPRLPGASSLGHNLALTLGRRSPADDDSRSEWHILPSQMKDGLAEWREHLLGSLSAGAEPAVGHFLEEAGRIAENRFDLEPLLRKLPLAGAIDPSAIRKVQITERALRMGVQLVWGSQGEMIRHGTEDFVGAALVEDDNFLLRLNQLLQWVLDYRVSDDHTTLILQIGRDTVPGRLELEAWNKPTSGGRLVGDMSGASRILVSAELEGETSWTRWNAVGSLIVLRLDGNFVQGEVLLLEGRDVGVFEEEQELDVTLSEGRGGNDGSTDGHTEPTPPPSRELIGLTKILFKAVARDSTSSQGSTRDRFAPAAPSAAPPKPALQAKLPGSLAATEWRAQELLLRDLAQEWHGELRTDPMWSFLRRRLSVHSQGGCTMGTEETPAFSSWDGQVVGCDGLYVMDAAGFPTSVGVNPSATIAAVAELKIERFIRKEVLQDDTWRAPEMEAATKWASDPEIKEMLSPKAMHQPHQATAPRSRPVGIQFAERMVGNGEHHSGLELEVESRLKVSIADLSQFLDLDGEGKPEPLLVPCGRVFFTKPADHKAEDLPSNLRVDASGHSYVWLRRDPVAGGRERRTMEYRLELIAREESIPDLDKDPAIGPSAGDCPPPEEDIEVCEVLAGDGDTKYLLTGEKVIRDDERLDAWEDATTLFFTLQVEKEGAEESDWPTLIPKGVLRLPVNDFFGFQVPNTRATCTHDKSRQVWALTAFGRFFFGHLADVYLPETGRFVNVARSIWESTHV